VDTKQSSAPAHPSTRELRALELYRTRRHDIERISPHVYLVPSCSGEGFYAVTYGGEAESCECKDFEFGHVCKHLFAVGIMHAKRRGAAVHARDALGDQLQHELMDDEERQELRDRVLRLRRRLSIADGNL
jgi:hypothetical protein